MYLFECETTFEAEPDTVWKLWTDVARWPEWDVSKEIARLDGPFQPGTRGWAKQRANLGGSFTITLVDAGRRRRPAARQDTDPGRKRLMHARPADIPGEG
jgi:hypothetical protein